MGNPYTAPSISAYNQNPPPDDGTESEANRGKYATVKTKLSDPVKTLSETDVTNTDAAFAKVVGGGGVTTSTAPYTVQASDQGKLVRITSAGTVTSATAATEGAPFVHALLNDSGGTVTFDGAAAETVDGQANITLPDGTGVFVFTDGTNHFTAGRGNIQDAASFVTVLPRGYLAGLQLSNDAGDTAHDIAIAVGECRDAANSANLSLSAIMTKQIDASWAAGDDAGGFPSGLSLSADTWYHVFVVDDGSGGVDAGYDTSVSATNLLSDSGGTLYRRLGAVLTDATNNIIQFLQHGNDFVWDDPTAALDVDTTTATTAANVKLSTPLGVKTRAHVAVTVDGTTTFAIYLSDPDQSDIAPTSVNGAVTLAAISGPDTGAQATVYTNASSQVRWRSEAAARAAQISTLGWTDTRGRDD